MAFIITKTKGALSAKSKSHKKQMSHKVSLVAMASTAPDDLLKEMKLDKRMLGSLSDSCVASNEMSTFVCPRFVAGSRFV